MGDISRELNGAKLDVMLGGLSLPLADGCGSCCIDSLTNASACAPETPMVGSFGNRKAAMAIECLPLEGTPSLADMTAVALSRLRAVVPNRGVFLVVAADRIDHAAHAGDLQSVEEMFKDVGSAINLTLSVLEERIRSGEALIMVTGDHLTNAVHLSDPVPLLVWGKSPVNLTDPSPMTSFQTMFPFGTPQCGGREDKRHAMLIVAAIVAPMATLVSVVWLVIVVSNGRRKHE